MSNVGYPSTYEDGDQRHYSKEAVREEGRTHGVNTEGYRKLYHNILDSCSNMRQRTRIAS